MPIFFSSKFNLIPSLILLHTKNSHKTPQSKAGTQNRNCQLQRAFFSFNVLALGTLLTYLVHVENIESNIYLVYNVDKLINIFI